MKNIVVALAIVVLLFWAVPAQADLISVARSQFGLGTVYESFEESIDYSNAQDHSNSESLGSIVLPGKTQNYVFSQSGITLVAPIPNLEGNFLPQIAIYKAQQGLGFADYGSINSSHLPPDGNKFLVEYGSSSVLLAPYELLIPSNTANKVGGYWMMYGKSFGSDKLEISAYGLTNNLLGTVLVSAASVNDGDWSNNFYGFASSDGAYIKKISINYWTGTTNVANPGVDMLMFDVVPEPSTLCLLAFATICIGGFALLYRVSSLPKKVAALRDPPTKVK
jgi:hypothetical protein